MTSEQSGNEVSWWGIATHCCFLVHVFIICLQLQISSRDRSRLKVKRVTCEDAKGQLKAWQVFCHLFGPLRATMLQSYWPDNWTVCRCCTNNFIPSQLISLGWVRETVNCSIPCNPSNTALFSIEHLDWVHFTVWFCIEVISCGVICNCLNLMHRVHRKSWNETIAWMGI